MGLTFGEKVAVEDNGWRMRTDQWCHMEPRPTLTSRAALGNRGDMEASGVGGYPVELAY